MGDYEYNLSRGRIDAIAEDQGRVIIPKSELAELQAERDRLVESRRQWLVEAALLEQERDRLSAQVAAFVELWPANVVDDSEGDWECRFCNASTRILDDDIRLDMLRDSDFATKQISHYDDCVWALAIQAGDAEPADNSRKQPEPLTADGDFKVADNAEAYEQVGWYDGADFICTFASDPEGLEPVYRKATQ